MNLIRAASDFCDPFHPGQFKPAAEFKALFINVHGVITSISVNSTLLHSAIYGFLKPYQIERSPGADIEIVIKQVPRLSRRQAPLPAGITPLYDWGPLKIYARGKCRFLDLEGKARMTAGLRHKRAVGFVDESLAASSWRLSRHFFYPLWSQLMKEASLFPIHGAALEKHGNAFLFPGRSGSGKSTLVVHLLRRGYRLLADDTFFLRLRRGRARRRGAVEVFGFHEDISIDPREQKFFPEIAGVEQNNMDQDRRKSSVSIEKIYPGAFTDRATPALLIFPEISGAAATRTERITKTEALALSLRYAYLFMDPSTYSENFQILAELARQVDCFRLYSGKDRGHMAETVDAMAAGSPDKDWG